MSKKKKRALVYFLVSVLVEVMVVYLLVVCIKAGDTVKSVAFAALCAGDFALCVREFITFVRVK